MHDGEATDALEGHTVLKNVPPESKKRRPYSESRTLKQIASPSMGLVFLVLMLVISHLLGRSQSSCPLSIFFFKYERVYQEEPS